MNAPTQTAPPTIRLGLERIPTGDPHDSGPAILGATWAFTGLCTIIVALRFYLRHKLNSGPNASDWLMLLALVSSPIHLSPRKHDQARFTN